MQEIRSSNPHVVTGICDPNNSRARNHRNLKCVRILLICYLAAPQPTLGHCLGDRLTARDINHCV